MKIFSIHDSKADAYNTPFYQKTPASAIRAFQSGVSEEGSELAKYASDYTLVELGEFDEQSGSIATHVKPRILANASEFINRIATPSQVSQHLKPIIDQLDQQN